MKVYTRKDKILYAQLAFPLAFAGLPLYIHAPDFYATHYGISLGFLGGALLFIRLLDAFLDPFIGRICDVLPQWRGHIVAASVVIFSVSFGALYTPPAALELFWFVLCIFAATLSFSVLLINLNTLGAILVNDYSEKTSLSAWREGFGVAGLICAIALPALLNDMSLYALSCSLIMAVSGFIFVMWLGGGAEAPSAPQDYLETPSLSVFLRKSFAGFYSCYGVSMLASALPAVLFMFFVRDWLGEGDAVSLFLLLYFIAGVSAIPLWQRLAAVWGNDRLWVAAMLISAAGISLAALTDKGDNLLFGIVCLASGAAFGGELFLAPAILATRIARSGMDQHASLFYGVYACFMKFSLALATLLAFAALEFAGFTPAGFNDDASLSVLVGLYAVLPAVIKIFAAIAYVKWRKNENHNQPFYSGSHHVS